MSASVKSESFSPAVEMSSKGRASSNLLLSKHLSGIIAKNSAGRIGRSFTKDDFVTVLPLLSIFVGWERFTTKEALRIAL